jgi:hypothetical protein
LQRAKLDAFLLKYKDAETKPDETRLMALELETALTELELGIDSGSFCATDADMHVIGDDGERMAEHDVREAIDSLGAYTQTAALYAAGSAHVVEVQLGRAPIEEEGLEIDVTIDWSDDDGPELILEEGEDDRPSGVVLHFPPPITVTDEERKVVCKVWDAPLAGQADG